MDSRGSASSNTAGAARSNDKGKAVIEASQRPQTMGDERQSYISQYRAQPSPTRGAAATAPWSCTRFSGSSSSRAVGSNVGNFNPGTQAEPGDSRSFDLLNFHQLQLQREQALLHASSHLLNNNVKSAREEEMWPLMHAAATVPAPAGGTQADTARTLMAAEEKNYALGNSFLFSPQRNAIEQAHCRASNLAAGNHQLNHHQRPAPSVSGNITDGQNISQAPSTPCIISSLQTAAVFLWNPENQVFSELSAGTPSPVSLHPQPQAQDVKEREWALILQKVLQKTDVGGLHRIILPKRDAEANLPRLENSGIFLEMLDMAYLITWKFKYRFWPGSRCRVYVLENTEEFVKKHKLVAGDRIVIYGDGISKYYLIGVIKHGSETLAAGSDDDDTDDTDNTDQSSEDDDLEDPRPCQKRKLTINLAPRK